MDSPSSPSVRGSAPPRGAFAVVAAQRSGTHLLREVINSNPRVALLAEPFSRYPQSVYWNNYVRTLPESQFPPGVPAEAMPQIDDYFELIHRDVDEHDDWYGGPKLPDRLVGLDVKYNQLRCVRPLYDDLRSRPVLIEYFAARRTPIVHLVRKNLVHAALSIIISNRREVWQLYEGPEVQGAFNIPLAELFESMQWVVAERKEFLRLSTDLRIHTCTYEDLVAEIANVDAEGQIREGSVLGGIAKFLGVEPKFRFHARIKKVLNRPYSELIDNYKDVVTAVRKSEFSEFAKTL